MSTTDLFKINSDTFKDLRATNEQLSKAEDYLSRLDKWDDYDSPIDIAFMEMETDGDSRIRESQRLIDYYINSDGKVKAAIDATLMCLCGWSLGHLIDKMEEPEGKSDEDDENDDEDDITV